MALSRAESLRRATDLVIALYLFATAALVLLFREALPSWRVLALLHVVGGVVAARLPRRPRRLPPVTAFLRDWYPALLFPLLYKEVEIFAAAFGSWRLTEPLRSLEGSLFAGQPSLYLSERLAWAPLSEYLHFCYLAYVLLLPLVGGIWYFRSKRVAFHELLLLVSVTYAASYLVYALVPVDSPFYLSDPPGAPLAGHPFYEAVHFLSARAGARGGAFPSSHVSIATVILLVTARYEKSWVWLLPLYAGLVFATVYGRFHYAVDVLAGWILALVVVVGFRLVSRAGRHSEVAQHDDRVHTARPPGGNVQGGRGGTENQGADGDEGG